MFPFDAAALPQLTTRKALIAVDFQNDFAGAQDGSGDGALPVAEPEGFVGRAIALSEAFRDGVGDVVWVQSCFDKARPADQEPIITSDTPRTGTSSGGSRRRGGAGRAKADPVLPVEEQGPPDPEAFLSHEQPMCVRASSPGAEMVPAAKGAVRKGDTVLTKSHYSAFLGTPLLRLLRAKMVMEVFICGSLANIGVYATALDAAGHGMAITVVEDCCGYRAESRQIKAVRSLIELTGCEIASYQEVLEVLQPNKGNGSKPRDKAEPAGDEEKQRRDENGAKPEKKDERSRSHEVGEAAPLGRASDSPDIVRPMTGLRLASDSPCHALAAKGAGDAAQADPPDTPSKQLGPRPAETLAASLNHVDGDGDGDDDGDDNDDDDDDDGDGADVDDADRKDSSATPRGRDHEDAPQPLPQPPTEKAPSPGPGSPSAQRQSEADSLKVAPRANSKPLPASPDTDDEDEDEDERGDEEKEKEEEEKPGQPQTTRGLCEGDTSVITNLLHPSVEAGIFDRLRDEVQWQRMSHQGGEVPRLVAVQGAVSPHDGSAPVYRHPSDESPPLLPFSPTVLAVRAAVEQHLGHDVNHVLVQFYRHGGDYISEHSDKTLDIARGSYIANVSLGAERTMVFRTKRDARFPSSTRPSGRAGAGDEDESPAAPPPRQVQRAALPHNSLCRMGLATNMRWLHAIRADRRADRDKTAPELAQGGARISLTFRRIATFIDADQAVIWGQGATAKTRAEARPVVNGQGPEAVAMLRAFGAENHASDFDWDAHYGAGFDVLHMRSAPRFFASPEDPVASMRVALMLAEYGIGYARGSIATAQNTGADAAEGPRPQPVAVRFVDNDAGRTEVQGDVAIMLYLESCHGPATAADAAAPSRAHLAARLTRFQRALQLRDMLRAVAPPASPPAAGHAPLRLARPVERELAVWDALAADAAFIAGPAMSVADFALWPVLHALVAEHGPGLVFDDGRHRLRRYYDAVAARESAVKVLGNKP